MSLNAVYVNTGIYKGAPMFAAYIPNIIFPQQCCCLMISDFLFEIGLPVAVIFWLCFSLLNALAGVAY